MAKFKPVNVTVALQVAALAHAERQKEWGCTSEFKPAIKYFKKLEVFKASNVSFDPATMEAFSYRWWKFVKLIGDTVVFNDYRYSPNTGGHQSAVRTLLGQLGIKIDVTIEAPKGLDRLDNSINYYLNCIDILKGEIANPRSRKSKNMERLNQIVNLEKQIKVVQGLIDIENRKYESLAA